jgi:hypothetical protein
VQTTGAAKYVAFGLDIFGESLKEAQVGLACERYEKTVTMAG